MGPQIQESILLPKITWASEKLLGSLVLDSLSDMIYDVYLVEYMLYSHGGMVMSRVWSNLIRA